MTIMNDEIRDQINHLFFRGESNRARKLLKEESVKNEKLGFVILPLLLSFSDIEIKSNLGYYTVVDEIKETVKVIRRVLSIINADSNHNTLKDLANDDRESLFQLISRAKLDETIKKLYTLSLNYPSIVQNRIIEIGYEYNRYIRARNNGILKEEESKTLQNKLTNGVLKITTSLDNISKYDYFNFNSLVFVIISFRDDMEKVYKKIYEIGDKYNFQALRVKDVQGNYKITEKVIELIASANFIIADLTHERPNVYYELGYARGIGKKIITLCNKNSEVHYDVQEWKTIMYNDTEDLALNLEQAIKGIKTNEDFK